MGRKSQPRHTPLSIKNVWAKDFMRNAGSTSAGAVQQRSQAQSSIIDKGGKKKWKNRWEHYLSTVPRSKKIPAYEGELGHQRNKLHKGLRKAESSLPIQLRTEKEGFQHSSMPAESLMWCPLRAIVDGDGRISNTLSFFARIMPTTVAGIRNRRNKSILGDYVDRKRSSCGCPMRHERRSSIAMVFSYKRSVRWYR